MTSSFFIGGIWSILYEEREVRLVIDKDRLGNVSVVQSRWLIKDKKYLIPLVNVNSVKIVIGDAAAETEDKLYLQYVKTELDHIETLGVAWGNKKNLVPLAQMISECLEVELIER